MIFRKGWIHPILQIVLFAYHSILQIVPVQNSWRGKEINQFCPALTTFAFSLVFILLLWSYTCRVGRGSCSSPCACPPCGGGGRCPGPPPPPPPHAAACGPAAERPNRGWPPEKTSSSMFALVGSHVDRHRFGDSRCSNIQQGMIAGKCGSSMFDSRAQRFDSQLPIHCPKHSESHIFVLIMKSYFSTQCTIKQEKYYLNLI